MARDPISELLDALTPIDGNREHHDAEGRENRALIAGYLVGMAMAARPQDQRALWRAAALLAEEAEVHSPWVALLHANADASPPLGEPE